MPFLISSATGARGILSGEFVRAKFDDYSVRTRIYLPPAITAIRRYSSFHPYSNRLYFAGAHFTENLLLDENYRMLRQGIRPPINAPVVSLSAGTTEQILYQSYYDELTGERSSLSEGTALTGGLTRTWSSIPSNVPGEILRAEGVVNKNAASATVTGVGAPAKTNFDMFRPGDRVLFSGSPARWTTIRTIVGPAEMTVDDLGIAAAGETLLYKALSRISHVELWVSVEGTLPRLAARVRLGTTDAVEAVPTLSLGEAFLENFEPMPTGTINAIYGDRQLAAGVPGHEDEVFLSNLFFMERWGGLSFKTRRGELITGIIGTDDYARIDTPDSSYTLQGYTEDDLTLTVNNPSLGALAHLTSVQIEENIWTPNRKNFYVYNGAWKPACEDRQSEWNSGYRQDPLAYEQGFTVYNPNDATIQFYPLYRASQQVPPFGFLPSETVWIADFSSVKFDAGGTMVQPYWMNDDYRAIPDDNTTETGSVLTSYWGMAAYLIPDGKRIGKLYRVAFPGGAIYYEDENVAYERDAILRTNHNFFTEEGADAGNNDNHGYILDSLWVNARTELSALRAGIWSGDEYAAEWQGRGLNAPSTPNVAVPTWPGGYPTGGFAEIAATLSEGSGAYRQDGVSYKRLAAKTIHYYRPMVTGRGHTLELRFVLPKQAKFLGWGGKILPGRATRDVVNAEPEPE